MNFIQFRLNILNILQLFCAGFLKNIQNGLQKLRIISQLEVSLPINVDLRSFLGSFTLDLAFYKKSTST